MKEFLIVCGIIIAVMPQNLFLALICILLGLIYPRQDDLPDSWQWARSEYRTVIWTAVPVWWSTWGRSPHLIISQFPPRGLRSVKNSAACFLRFAGDTRNASRSKCFDSL